MNYELLKIHNLPLKVWALHQKYWLPATVAWKSSAFLSSLTKWWKAMRTMRLSIMKPCWKWAKCAQRLCRRLSASSSVAWTLTTTTTTLYDVIHAVPANQNLIQKNLQLSWLPFYYRLLSVFCMIFYFILYRKDLFQWCHINI